VAKIAKNEKHAKHFFIKFLEEKIVIFYETNQTFGQN
jgi:hypothetical protein